MLFPGIPTVQFLIALQDVKMEGERPGPFYFMNDVNLYQGGSGLNKPFPVVSVQVLQFQSGKLTAHSGCVGDSSPFVCLGRL